MNAVKDKAHWFYQKIKSNQCKMEHSNFNQCCDGHLHRSWCALFFCMMAKMSNNNNKNPIIASQFISFASHSRMADRSCNFRENIVNVNNSSSTENSICNLVCAYRRWGLSRNQLIWIELQSVPNCSSKYQIDWNIENCRKQRLLSREPFKSNEMWTINAFMNSCKFMHVMKWKRVEMFKTFI